jgi:hypothetical protein
MGHLRHLLWRRLRGAGRQAHHGCGNDDPSGHWILLGFTDFEITLARAWAAVDANRHIAELRTIGRLTDAQRSAFSRT